VRAVIWGLGAMGEGIARVLSDRPGADIVGLIERDPDRARGVREGLPRAAEIPLLSPASPAEVGDFLACLEPDICLLATSSFLREVQPQIEQALASGANVIALAEEMAYPWAYSRQIARSLDLSARRAGATVLGTGINPGFVLDTLILVLTTPMTAVESIYARRVNDLSPFGASVMAAQGVGLTLEQFARGVEYGSVVGHVGFPASLHLLARALDRTLDRIEEEREPIVALTRREARHVKVEPGMVAGCRHTARGFEGTEPFIVLEHPQQVQPEAEGVATGDFIHLRGSPSLQVSISPEIPGGMGTVALAVNMIPQVLAAPPGLATMLDLGLPHLRGRRMGS